MKGLDELYYVPLICTTGVFVLLLIYHIYTYDDMYEESFGNNSSTSEKKKKGLHKFTKDTFNGVVRGSVVGSITGGPVGALSGGIVYGLVSPILEHLTS